MPPEPPPLRAAPKPGKGAAEPEAFTAFAADGYAIRGFAWRHGGKVESARPVVIINPATSVLCRYYFRFAAFLHAQGFDVIAYDYRGIGGSRPETLRGFDACWIDWGHLDFEAVLRHAGRAFPGQPVDVVAHSVGGFVLGFAASNPCLRRVVCVGAQYAYWRDYAAGSRLRMLAKWHVAMPLLTAACGYFPGRRLGWLEDTPQGVVLDWIRSGARFERGWRGHSAARYPDRDAFVRRFAALTAPLLAISVTDDEFATVPAVERLLAYFGGSPRTHLRIAPDSIGAPSIGHFGFFHSRFETTLWPLALHWLTAAALPADAPGTRVSEAAPDADRTTAGGPA